MSWQFEEEEIVLVDEKSEEGRGLVVFNDEVNSFDHVIDTLIKVCEHERIQAEQCTYIIHFNGKCEVKKGSYDDLKPMKEGIIDAGINAVIV
ncbi:Clp protease ClpS [Reichenbachiella sp. 5M10]|uniref:ATP-dependent Clp protease adaptor ClpS n=1 Tax=Reichenbachiella sp. 5M10 TaxID=1889772 RepID=UPI000C14E83A|nr:ATP-dependent Clp protease adaptor ClpS [Reichenbachiella sp. 5M10]PIB36011.1 Clp protease ClpS [Reichenbachiella sp. 5M10]